MEGLESLVTLEEKQALQDQRVAAWRARAGSGSSDVFSIGGMHRASNTGLGPPGRSRSEWEALIREWEQPLEDDSDYQAQTESVPSGEALNNLSPSSDNSSDLNIGHASRSDSGSVSGDPSASDSSSRPLALARIRSAGTPPPSSTARSRTTGRSESLPPSARVGRSNRRSWNAHTKLDLDRAEFGRAQNHRKSLRRTTSVPPRIVWRPSSVAPRSKSGGQETDRSTQLRFKSPPPIPTSTSASTSSSVLVTATSFHAEQHDEQPTPRTLVRSPSPISSSRHLPVGRALGPTLASASRDSAEPSPKPILRKSLGSSRPSSVEPSVDSSHARASMNAATDRPQLRRQATVHLSSPYLPTRQGDVSVSPTESESEFGLRSESEEEGSGSDPAPSDPGEPSEAEQIRLRPAWSPRPSRGMTSASPVASSRPFRSSAGGPRSKSLSRSPLHRTTTNLSLSPHRRRRQSGPTQPSESLLPPLSPGLICTGPAPVPPKASPWHRAVSFSNNPTSCPSYQFQQQMARPTIHRAARTSYPLHTEGFLHCTPRLSPLPPPISPALQSVRSFRSVRSAQSAQSPGKPRAPSTTYHTSAPHTPRFNSLVLGSPPAFAPPSVAITPVQAAGQVYSPAISPLGCTPLSGRSNEPWTNNDDGHDWHMVLPASVAQAQAQAPN